MTATTTLTINVHEFAGLCHSLAENHGMDLDTDDIRQLRDWMWSYADNDSPAVEIEWDDVRPTSNMAYVREAIDSHLGTTR